MATVDRERWDWQEALSDPPRGVLAVMGRLPELAAKSPSPMGAPVPSAQGQCPLLGVQASEALSSGPRGHLSSQMTQAQPHLSLTVLLVRGGACPQSLGFLNTSMRCSGHSVSQRDGDCQVCHGSGREGPHRTDCPLVPWTYLVTAALLNQWLTSPLVHDRAGLTAALAQNSEAAPAGAFTTNAQLLRDPGGRRHWQIEL